MTYSVDLRRHVLLRQKEGLTFEQTAKRFAVGIASLTRWNKSVIPKATRENRPRKVDLKAFAKASRSKKKTFLGGMLRFKGKTGPSHHTGGSGLRRAARCGNPDAYQYGLCVLAFTQSRSGVGCANSM